MILDLFKQTTQELIQELSTIYPNDPEVLKAKILVNGYDDEKLMTRFIKNAMPYKAAIETSDEKVFIKNGDKIFSFFAPGHFEKLWVAGNLDKPMIWKYFQVLIKLASKYMEKK